MVELVKAGAGAFKANLADTPVYHLKQPSFPQFRFEWHERAKTVYMIRVGAMPEIGEPIAENQETHGQAQMAVLIWLRGYQQKSLELGQGVTIKRG